MPYRNGERLRLLGESICGTLRTASLWAASWGKAPLAWQSGEPVSALSNLHWLQPLAPGDLLLSSGELIRIIKKVGPSEYIIERGVGPDQSYQNPRAHSEGTTWMATCEPDGARFIYQTL